MKMMRLPMMAALAALSLTLVTGAFAQPTLGNGQKGQKGQKGQQGAQRGGMNLKALTKALDLTQEQQDKLKPAFDKATEARKKLKEDTTGDPKEKRAKTKEIATDIEKAVEAVLTADQKTKFEEMKKKMAEAAKKGKKGTTPPPPAQA